ncbi:MAG: VOC family protein [Acidobacteria bacterium]|nr:VOC family protein [Acidobacteriota bacterium]
MSARVAHSTPMLHVAEIERSIAFYEQLGFRLIDDDGCKPIGWARLHCESGDIMFLRAEKSIDARVQGFLFYLYTPDLAGLREHLAASDVAVSEIKRPAYMPSGTINLNDPDGYHIEIGHWGKAEQEAWEKHLEAR